LYSTSAQARSAPGADVLIGGWEFTDLLTHRSGLPVNIVVSRLNTALPDHNNVNQRPDLLPGEPLYSANRSIKQRFNPSAFAVPAMEDWANAPRDFGTITTTANATGLIGTGTPRVMQFAASISF